MVSIDEVARLAGVSTATVSRALSGRGHVSDPTRARVESAAKSLGYVVSSSASSLASGRTRNIGVLVPFLDRWFFSTVLSGIASALMRRGYDITLYTLTADRDAAAQRLRDLPAPPAGRRGHRDLDRARRGRDRAPARTRPAGDRDRRPEPAAVDAHASTTSRVARLATEHLIALGHRDIAHIGASPEFDIDFHIPTHRRQGFEQALADAGIPARPALYEPADFTIEGGFRAAKQLLGRPGARPTAIFAASDEMAIGALLAARELGYRVPEDLSVVGIDGHELGEFFRLTTVDQFPLGQGERAADAILDELEARVPPPRAKSPAHLPYELIVAAPPPASTLTRPRPTTGRTPRLGSTA